MTSNPFKTGGPDVDYVVGYVKCCRVWPIITATLTATTEGWKREYWHWRTCGLCHEMPRFMEAD